MNYKKILLLIPACLFILIYFNITANEAWLDNRIKSISEEMDKINEYPNHMDPEFRREFKLQDPYQFSQKVKSYLEERHVKDPLILVPDEMQKYAYSILRRGNTGAVVEPILLYLYTGLKGAQWDSKNVHDCNYGIVFSPDGHPTLIELHNPHQIDSIIDIYQSFVVDYKKQFK